MVESALPMVESALSVKDDVFNGEVDVSFVPTLRKRDFQLFMKSLRAEFGEGIRFLLVLSMEKLQDGRIIMQLSLI